MKRRDDTNPRLLLSTLRVVRWFLFSIVVMGIGLDKTFGWIAGGPTALSTNPRHNIFGNHREPRTRSGGPSSSSSALSATCRICRGSHDPLFNEAFSCVYHPGSIQGESPRKSDWEDENYDENGKRKNKAKESIYNSQLVYTYTCCGGTPYSEGCTRGKHKSFDDP
jgi:hypothetical protein